MYLSTYVANTRMEDMMLRTGDVGLKKTKDWD